MHPSKEQLAHDLAMACVSGMIQLGALEMAKHPLLCGGTDPETLAGEALDCYEKAYQVLSARLQQKE